ncbi:S-layer homology domain-containing protein [uncultured Agathobaculum sp.]|uniref:S-layer homology domain-containing protein n=1 Tax=uncultured Agathobaculum sp. TaxID=2048140 RepID=UPI00320984DB
MKKRLLSAFLCMFMLTAMLPFASAASDLEGHWAKTYIEYLDREGVINPSATTGKYEPNRDMTRAEFMRYINRAFHFTEMAAISYTDVPKNAWYYDTVRIAQKYGYINGVGDNKMDPEGKVTREQAAVIVGRLFKADPGDVSPSDLTFTDRDEISGWSAGYIKAASDKGFLAGYSDGSFQPDRVVTRGEVAKILYYYMGTSLSTAGKAYTGADLKTDTTNVTISESCSLSDATIQGDLYITEGLGSDAVTLNNVTVKGSVIVSGGTVTMMNTSSDHMIVSSPMARLLQITATGAARIGKTEVQSAAALHERSLAAEDSGFSEVVVNGEERVSLTLDANVDQLTLAGESTVSTTANTQIYQMTVEKAASVTGYGSVYQADIQTDGVSFASSVTVSGYAMADGVSATIGGQSVNGISTAGVVPKSITVDLANPSALGSDVTINVPNGTSVSAVFCSGKSLNESSDYTKTASGIAVSSSYLTSLAKGNYTLSLSLSDGQRESIALSVVNSEEDAQVQAVTFDRYYRSDGFQNVIVKLDGVMSENDILGVVLGFSKIDYKFNNVNRSLVLRRGVLAQLRTGTYTVSADLKNGGSSTFNLTVTDSTPAGMHAYVAEYNTYAPTEPSFALPLSNLTVSSVTATQNGETTELAAGTDYTTSDHSLTLTKAGLEKFRQTGGLVEFTVTMSDDSVYTLVIDYI